ARSCDRRKLWRCLPRPRRAGRTNPPAPGRPGRGPVLPTPAAQRVQLGEPPLVTRPPCGHAVAQPVFLHRDLAPELVLLARFLFEHRIAPRLESRDTLVHRPGDAAVEPYGASREP